MYLCKGRYYAIGFMRLVRGIESNMFSAFGHVYSGCKANRIFIFYEYEYLDQDGPRPRTDYDVRSLVRFVRVTVHADNYFWIHHHRNNNTHNAREHGILRSSLQLVRPRRLAVLPPCATRNLDAAAVCAPNND